VNPQPHEQASDRRARGPDDRGARQRRRAARPRAVVRTQSVGAAANHPAHGRPGHEPANELERHPAACGIRGRRERGAGCEAQDLEARVDGPDGAAASPRRGGDDA